MGAELVDGLVIKQGDYKLVKTRFSAFFATHLHSFLQNSGVNNLVVVGIENSRYINSLNYESHLLHLSVCYFTVWCIFLNLSVCIYICVCRFSNSKLH